MLIDSAGSTFWLELPFQKPHYFAPTPPSGSGDTVLPHSQLPTPYSPDYSSNPPEKALGAQQIKVVSQQRAGVSLQSGKQRQADTLLLRRTGRIANTYLSE